MLASIVISRSKPAPASVASDRQSPRASSHIAPFGANGRPSSHANVTSSGATMPARAPASIDMLQIVRRPSIESARIAEPRYSMTLPVPPAVPIRAMMPRITSFAAQSAGSTPSTVTAIVPGFVCEIVCVASTCSISLVPMPHASAPSAPCVDVWLSPHTIVMPGCVSPSCGEMTWTMPWFGSPVG